MYNELGEAQREDFFLQNAGELLPQVLEFSDKSVSIQHEILRNLARVNFQIIPQKNDYNECEQDSIQYNCLESFDTKKQKKSINTQAKVNDKIIATFKTDWDMDHCIWKNTHRFCQPQFRGNGIMKQLLVDTENFLQQKGIQYLQFQATGIQAICWALAQGFQILNAKDRQDFFKYLREIGWKGQSPQKEFYEKIIILTKKLD